jgi:vancomycin permeability regulator SanA
MRAPFTFAFAFAFALAGCADARDVFRPYVPNAQEMREVRDQPWAQPVMDVAFVLGCPANPDGTPSPCQRCRVDMAVEKFRSGKVRNLLFSGGAAHSPAVEADVMGDLAVASGVPAAHVLREGQALTTWQNVRFSERIARARGFRTVLFVSTADHLPRARRIARFYGLDDRRTAYVACDLDPMEAINR